MVLFGQCQKVQIHKIETQSNTRNHNRKTTQNQFIPKPHFNLLHLIKRKPIQIQINLNNPIVLSITSNHNRKITQNLILTKPHYTLQTTLNKDNPSIFNSPYFKDV